MKSYTSAVINEAQAIVNAEPSQRDGMVREAAIFLSERYELQFDGVASDLEKLRDAYEARKRETADTRHEYTEHDGVTVFVELLERDSDGNLCATWRREVVLHSLGNNL